MASHKQISPPSKSSGDFHVTPLGADLGASEAAASPATVFYSSRQTITTRPTRMMMTSLERSINKTPPTGRAP
jgi:hypothetical protein